MQPTCAFLCSPRSTGLKATWLDKTCFHTHKTWEATFAIWQINWLIFKFLQSPSRLWRAEVVGGISCDIPPNKMTLLRLIKWSSPGSLTGWSWEDRCYVWQAWPVDPTSSAPQLSADGSKGSMAPPGCPQVGVSKILLVCLGRELVGVVILHLL